METEDYLMMSPNLFINILWVVMRWHRHHSFVWKLPVSSSLYKIWVCLIPIYISIFDQSFFSSSSDGSMPCRGRWSGARCWCARTSMPWCCCRGRGSTSGTWSGRDGGGLSAGISACPTCLRVSCQRSWSPWSLSWWWWSDHRYCRTALSISASSRQLTI